MPHATAPIVLASASPRRSELMALAGITCDVVPADICEDPLPGGQPDEQKRFMKMCTYKMLALPDAGVPEL